MSVKNTKPKFFPFLILLSMNSFSTKVFTTYTYSHWKTVGVLCVDSLFNKLRTSESDRIPTVLAERPGPR